MSPGLGLSPAHVAHVPAGGAESPPPGALPGKCALCHRTETFRQRFSLVLRHSGVICFRARGLAGARTDLNPDLNETLLSFPGRDTLGSDLARTPPPHELCYLGAASLLVARRPRFRALWRDCCCVAAVNGMLRLSLCR
jgi:hypothetical protein